DRRRPVQGPLRAVAKDRDSAARVLRSRGSDEAGGRFSENLMNVVIPERERGIWTEGRRRKSRFIAPHSRPGPSLPLLMNAPHPPFGHLLPASGEKGNS